MKILGFDPTRRPLCMPDPANKKQLTGEQELKLAIDSSYEIGMTPVTKQEMEDLRQIIFA